MSTRRSAHLALVLVAAAVASSARVLGAQQTGAIGGTVRSADGIPLRGAEVVLDGGPRRAAVGYDGAFVIRRVPVGPHSLTARLIGYAPVSRAVDVAADRETRLEISLSAAAVSLSEIRVLGTRRYGASTSGTALKMDAPVLDVPQSVVVISQDFIQDQHAITLDDLMRNVAGVAPFSDYQDFTARGFRSGEDEVTYNGTRSNMVNFFGTPTLYNVEGVEVVRGPSGVLYGALEGGAMINLVTKKPKATPARSVQGTAGSFHDYAAAIDLTGPVDAANTVLYRFTTHYEGAHSFRRFLQNKSWHAAPSLTWLPTTSTSLTLLGDLESEHKKGARNRGTAAVLGDLYALPVDWTSNEPTDYANSDAYAAEVDLSQRLWHKWTFDATSRYSYSDYENAYHESQGFACSIGNATTDALLQSCQSRGGRLLMRRQFRQQDFKWKNMGTTATAGGELSTGPVTHRLLLGGDYTYKNRLTSPSDYANGAPSGPVSSLDLLAPQYGVDVSRYVGAAPADAPFARNSNDWGVHASDMITFIPQVKGILGIRRSSATYDAINLVTSKSDRSTRWATSGRAGLVVEPTPWVSLYGSFTEGFKPQTSSYEDRGGPFDPLVTHQLESGIKFGLFQRRLMLTSSLYRIRKENVVVPDPVKANYFTQLGEVTSRGDEIEAIGQITGDWNLTANYAHNNTITTKDSRPTIQGTGFPNAPHDQGAFWTRYDVRRIRLGLAAGATHVGRRTTFDTTILPAYTVYDGALYYDWRWYKLQFNVKNVTNERWFSGGYNAYQLFSGSPRTFSATLNATF